MNRRSDEGFKGLRKVITSSARPPYLRDPDKGNVCIRDIEENEVEEQGIELSRLACMIR